MARIRTVKPEFWGDPKIARCSRDARLLFLGLFNESDDEGRQLGSPRKIGGVVFPNDEDVTPARITKWLDELERERLVARYDVDGVSYLLILGFVKHQKVNRPSPSRLPCPPSQFTEGVVSDSGVTTGALSADLGSGSRNIGSDSAPPPWRGSGESPIDFAVHLRAREAGA